MPATTGEQPTFSIVGRCDRTGEIGVAVASGTIAVGARSAQARSGAGAVVIQNAASPALVRETLDLLQSDLGPAASLSLLTDDRVDIEFRQILMIDRRGDGGHFTGRQVARQSAVCEVRNAVAGGCGLGSAMLPSAIIMAFDERADRPLAARLIAGLAAGCKQLTADEAVHSAFLSVAGRQKWPHIDLRVDWHQSSPVSILRGLWDGYRPDIERHIGLALHPGRPGAGPA